MVKCDTGKFLDEQFGWKFQEIMKLKCLQKNGLYEIFFIQFYKYVHVAYTHTHTRVY